MTRALEIDAKDGTLTLRHPAWGDHWLRIKPDGEVVVLRDHQPESRIVVIGSADA